MNVPFWFCISLGLVNIGMLIASLKESPPNTFNAMLHIIAIGVCILAAKKNR